MGDFEREPVLNLHRLRAGSLSPASTIDDETWADLDLDQVLDLFPTRSELGRLVLYGWLRCPAIGPAEREDVRARRWVEAPAARTPVLAALGHLPRLPSLLVETLWGDQKLPSLGRLPQVMAVIAVLSSLAFVVSVKVGLLASSLAFLTNFGLHLWWGKQVHTALSSLEFTALALVLGARLATESSLSLAARSTLTTLSDLLRPLRKQAQQLNLPTVLSEFTVYKDIWLLTAERRLSACAALIAQHRDALRSLFEALGSLDANFAIDAFVSEREMCVATLGTPGALVLEGARHPLLGDAAVPNSVELPGVLVVTGSNMSGKSTFLRAVAINTLFAQSLGFSCARRYAGPLVRIVTSLRVADRLTEGRSTYLAEAQRLKTLLTQASTQTLFVIDEPFRGTNSNERIAASIALFNYLGRNGHLVAGATHDLEVGRAAEAAGAQLAHFADGVTAQGLTFDFQLRPGLSNERNAIEVLRFLQYPQELLDEADQRLRSPAPP